MRWLVSSITLYSGEGGPSSKTHLIRPVPLSLVCTNDASVSTRNLRVNRCDASISALCLCLRRPGLHVRHNDASIRRNTREWNDFHSFVLVLASLRRTCKPGRRKERKLKKSDKLSALPFAKWRQEQLLIFLCLCACVCHLMLMLIARVNILVLVLKSYT